MPRINITNLTGFLMVSFFLTTSTSIIAQDSNKFEQNSDFFKRLKFGGSLGAGFGNGYTDIMLAPSAIYPVNETFSVGVGLQGSYVQSKNFFESYIYGGSLLALVNPIPELQLSAELEQLRVNRTYDASIANVALRSTTENAWNTALFLGLGYRSQNATVGIRYNVLYNKKDNVYGAAWMPFIRLYF